MGNQRRTEQRNDRITLAVLAMVPERKDANIGQKCGGQGRGQRDAFSIPVRSQAGLLSLTTFNLVK